MTLTKTQSRHLKSVKKYIKDAWWKHTYTELAEYMEMEPQSCREMVGKLIDAGYVSRLEDGQFIVRKESK